MLRDNVTLKLWIIIVLIVMGLILGFVNGLTWNMKQTQEECFDFIFSECQCDSMNGLSFKNKIHGVNYEYDGRNFDYTNPNIGFEFNENESKK